ncbi:MAG: M48 family metallopeptidase [Hyphomicrobium sp.]
MRKSRPAAATKTSKSNLDDIGAKLEVRRHPGARRLTLRVSRTRRAVLVTIPVQCDLDEAGSFLNRHIDWVRERLDSLPDPVPFANGAVMPLRGEPHRIVVAIANPARPVTRAVMPEQWPHIVVPGPAAQSSRRLRDWLFEEARGDLDRRVARHARFLGLNPKRIAVRDQTTRWGSCSTTGVLSFSWRLVLAPAHVLDYVAAHEVAHLAEMNHGPRFWALVKKAMPAYELSKTWLQVYGPDLHRYGAAHARSA